MPRNNNLRTQSTPPKEKVPPKQPQPQSVQSILDFVIPTEHVELPSRGKFYSSEHPLYNNESVEIKYISAKELDILTSESLLKKGIAIDRMIQSILVDPEIEVEDLYIGDKNAILVSSRVGSFGSDYPAEFVCESCAEQISHTFDLSSLIHKGAVEDDMEISENGTFFIELPQTKVMAECRLLTSKDDKLMDKLKVRNKKLGLSAPGLSDQYKLFIVSLNGITDRGLVDEFVNVMPVNDLHYLSKSYETIRPDLDLSEVVVCEKCDVENNVILPFTANFFWPEQ